MSRRTYKIIFGLAITTTIIWAMVRSWSMVFLYASLTVWMGYQAYKK